jgi:putative ABC transport system permease protein
MFKNNIITTIRNLIKQKGYSFINIIGLAIGVASALMILLYVQEELSYDRFHENADQIHRIYIDGKIAGDEIIGAISCAPIGATMMKDYPEVVNSTRLFTFGGEPIIRFEDKNFVVEKFYYADSTFFDVFTVEFLRGDPKTALNRVNTLVLTEEIAERLFGKDDPLGKSLKVGNDGEDFEITGVVRGFPKNSHFSFNILGSLITIPQLANSTMWIGNNSYTYILLQEGTSYKDLEAKMPEMVAKYAGPQMQMFSNATWEEFLEGGNKYGYKLQPLKDIHLRSDLEYEIEPQGNITTIYIFSIIAFFLIIIASINFMNLATARSAGRAREVGIKKVVGSYKSQLVRQFLFESILLSFISLLVALLLVELLLPNFNNFTGRDLALFRNGEWSFLPYIIALGLFVGLLAGSYPAFYLASFRPVKVLKGSIQTGMKGGYLRSILVIFQFTIAIFLIVSTVVVYRQLQYVQKKDLGYEKENLLVIDRAYALRDQRNAFKDELLTNPAIKMVSQTNNLPSYIHGNTAYRPEGAGPDEIRATNLYFTDENFQKTMGIELLKGRWFSKDIPGDSTAVVLNEAAVKAYGFEDPVGKNIMRVGGNPDSTDLKLTIIGVVKDFNYESLHQSIKPLIIEFNRNRFASYFIARIHPDNYQGALAFIEEKWNSIVPDQPMEYGFLDDTLSTNYKDDRNAGILYALFAILAIFVSSLGLLGLASFTAEQRTKEIGIRKVVGASVPLIMRLLSREVVWLVIISSVIAWPLAYFFMKNWLQNFAFSVNLGVVIFFLASVFTLAIAILTTGFQAYRAATSNPANTLRYE